jgi:hypothetical protein
MWMKLMEYTTMMQLNLTIWWELDYMNIQIIDEVDKIKL